MGIGGIKTYSTKVESVTNEGNFVVKTDFLPEINAPVFDSDGLKIGTVKRIFGPVNAPFVTVVPTDKSVLSKIDGKKICFGRDAQHGKRKRRHRGN